MTIGIDVRKIGRNSTGDEVYTYNLVAELAKLEEAGKHVFYLLTDCSVSEAKKNMPPGLPSNFKIFSVTPSHKLFWTFYSLPLFLRKNPVDVLHVQYISPFHLSERIKLITTVHDISFKVNPKWVGWKDSLLLNKLIPPSIKRANGILTVSEFSKREIIKYYGLPEKKIFVTHPAVGESYRNPPGLRTSREKVEEILKDDAPYVLHISSLQPRKNVPLIIQAFKQAKRSLRKTSWENLKLVIVGKKNGHNYDREIDKAVEGEFREDMIFTGYLPFKALPCLYRAALLFVIPSMYEGFGIPLVEAMCCKTPVVASNIKVFKEVGGEAPVYFDIGKSVEEQIEEMADSFIKIAEDEGFRMARINKGLSVRDKFSWQLMAEKTLGVYEKV